MIRILHIVSYMQRGGLETLIMNCYRHIDREKMQFDFIVHRDFRADYDDEIEALGGIIYRLPRLNPFHPGYYHALDHFFRKHPEYRIVHCHLDCMSGIPLSVAKKHGIPVRIAHGHSSNQDKDWKYPLKRLYMRKISTVATHFFACSKEAGEWMFPGQNSTVINNGIETSRFAFNPETRSKMREELGLCDKLVIGHVGRFVPTKNHDFLIDIFHQVYQKHNNSVLLLAGTGPLEDAVKQKVDRLGISEHVHFLGVRSDINRIMQAIDVFVLPSMYEGLGIVAVEAQATGAHCVVSNAVPAACAMTNLVEFVALDEAPAHWADVILQLPVSGRTDHTAEIRSAGYDIQMTADWLQDFYRKMW